MAPVVAAAAQGELEELHSRLSRQAERPAGDRSRLSERNLTLRTARSYARSARCAAVLPALAGFLKVAQLERRLLNVHAGGTPRAILDVRRLCDFSQEPTGLTLRVPRLPALCARQAQRTFTELVTEHGVAEAGVRLA